MSRTGSPPCRRGRRRRARSSAAGRLSRVRIVERRPASWGAAPGAGKRKGTPGCEFAGAGARGRRWGRGRRSRLPDPRRGAICRRDGRDRMTTRLRRCRDWWGECALREDLPRCGTSRDAVYLPHGFEARGACSARTAGSLPTASTARPRPAGLPAAPDAEYLYLGHLVPHYGTSSSTRCRGCGRSPAGRPAAAAPDSHLRSAAGLRRPRLPARHPGAARLAPEDLVAFAEPVRIGR